MADKKRWIACVLVLVCAAALFSGCKSTKKTVVIYTSVDQVYSEKIFALFEQESGIDVQPVYDIEAAKTVGLANKILEEKDNPQADLFWNGEILQTISLAQAGAFEKADIAAAKELPASFVDANGYWYGFGGRARVLLYNTALISQEDCPKTMEELASSPYLQQCGMANPVFGTTSTQAAALYAYWGADKAKGYFTSLKTGGISVLEGNSVVKDYVSQKKLYMGLTDTDDALSEMEKNSELDILFLDQGTADMGTMIVPNTVAQIKGAPHPAEADAFMEFLLSASTEQLLIDDGWIQLPAHEGVTPASGIEIQSIKFMDIDFNQVYDLMETAKADMTDIFVQ